MNDLLEDRVLTLSNYIIKNNVTVRSAAKVFGVSKSTVYTDVTKRLSEIDKELSYSVREILDENKSQRHIRGGLATKEKYEKRKGKMKK